MFVRGFAILRPDEILDFASRLQQERGLIKCLKRQRNTGIHCIRKIKIDGVLLKVLRGLRRNLTLSVDPETGEYTRLTRFHPGADTAPFGGKSHQYPEEIFIVSGRLYDQAFDIWLEMGHYASRPPGQIHGPFRTDAGCVVLEISFPGKVNE